MLCNRDSYSGKARSCFCCCFLNRCDCCREKGEWGCLDTETLDFAKDVVRL